MGIFGKEREQTLTNFSINKYKNRNNTKLTFKAILGIIWLFNGLVIIFIKFT